MSFEEFFRRASGFAPYPYQSAIAARGLPAVLEAPPGVGKTEAVVLAWLFRLLFHSDPAVRAATPRRLVYALPMRALTQQTRARIQRILERLGLDGEVALHVLMGGELDRRTQNRWRTDAHKPSIVIGTIDCVLSRALMRGYGASPAMYPMDFALVLNGAHVVVDEVQLVEQATVTWRQIASFQQLWGTAEPTGLTCMSATVDPRALDTVDHPFDPAEVVGLTDDDRRPRSDAPGLSRRLNATRTVHAMSVTDEKNLASGVLSVHRRGQLTIVVVNNVDTAVKTARHVRKLAGSDGPEVIVAHSRFRGVDRDAITSRITDGQPDANVDRIVVSTQVIEAGVDLDCAVLVTEAAPWPSLAQRAGRCNRAGLLEDAELHWFAPVGKNQPYAAEDLERSVSLLSELEGLSVTTDELIARQPERADLAVKVIRRGDFWELFDTTPDLSGRYIDVSRYIRESDPLDVQIAWVDDAWRTADPVAPPEAMRCSVPLASARKFVAERRGPVYTFDPFRDDWVEAANRHVRPGALLVAHHSAGGYTVEDGFDVTSKKPVPVDPKVVRSPQDPTLTTDIALDVGTELQGAEPGSVLQPGWQSLVDHSRETQTQAAALTQYLAPELPDEVLCTVVFAALLHDIGKAHEGWQRALLTTNAEADRPQGSGPWAKSPGRARLVVRGDGDLKRTGFRHELVSALVLASDEGRERLTTAGMSESAQVLVRYLVAAHHGKVRMQVADAVDDGRAGAELLGLREGDELSLFDPLEGDVTPNVAQVDVRAFRSGPTAWSDAAVALLQEWGPFRLAYLETLVRVADWRASQGAPVAPSGVAP